MRGQTIQAGSWGNFTRCSGGIGDATASGRLAAFGSKCPLLERKIYVEPGIFIRAQSGHSLSSDQLRRPRLKGRFQGIRVPLRFGYRFDWKFRQAKAVFSDFFGGPFWVFVGSITVTIISIEAMSSPTTTAWGCYLLEQDAIFGFVRSIQYEWSVT